MNRIILIVIIILSVVLLFVSFDLKPELGDEGILAMDGWRILKGQMPQKDFFQFIPPLAAYIQAFFFLIFSPTIFSIRILGFIYGILLLLGVYLLFSKFISNKLVLSLAFSFIVIFGISGWYFGSHHWLCNLLIIFGFYILKKGNESGNLFYSFISGAIVGLSVFTLQDQGGYAVVGLFLAGLFAKNELKNQFIYASLTGAATFFILSAPFLLKYGASPLFKDWVLFPLLNYRQNIGNKTGISFIWEQFLGLWDARLLKLSPLFSFSYAIFHTFILLLPVVCIISLYYLHRTKYLSRSDFLIVAVFSLLFLLTALRRASISNFIWASPGALSFFIFADKILAEGKKMTRALLNATLLTLVGCALIYGFVKFSFCVNKNYVFSAQTSAGSYRFFNKYECAQFQELVDEIEKRVPKEEKLFCVGYIPLFNFVTQRENPTRFNFVYSSGYNTELQIFNWIDAIERNGIKYGIGEKKESGKYLRKFVLKNYKTVFENDKYYLLQRNG